MKTVLNIGAGPTSLESQTQLFKELGYTQVRVDIHPKHADVVSDLRDLKEFEDSTVDAIWASHVVEHLHFHELPSVFNSMVRVLKDDGFAIISVPNLGAIADRIRDGLLEPVYRTQSGIDVTPLDMIYGFRPDIAGDDPIKSHAMMHKTGFTAKSMMQVLQSLNISALVAERDLEVVAVLYKGLQPSSDVLKYL